MEGKVGTQMLQSLESAAYKKRLERAHRFERVSGGGAAKHLERLFTDPGFYIPYVLYAKLGLSRLHLITATLFWGRKIQIPLEDYDALIIYMYGALHGSEMKFTKYLIKNLTPEDVFYDIGANRGFYTFLAADLCKETHAFEPMSSLTEVIKKSIRKNDHIIANDVALSSTNGSIDFYITDSTMVNTTNASVAELISSRHYAAPKKVTVPTMTLDEYVKNHTKPTIMKIDVEGAEDEVIKGGEDLFSQNAPIVAMEIWGKENKWELSMNAAERLRSMGYQSYKLDEEGNAVAVDGDLSALVPSVGGENYIFKKR